MSQCVVALTGPIDSAADHALGNSVGANGWSLRLVVGCPRVPSAGVRLGRVLPRKVTPSKLTTLPPHGGWPSDPLCGTPSALKIVTWLILPVVICLSQRLSHACLSISNLYCETANGSLNQLSFI